MWGYVKHIISNIGTRDRWAVATNYNKMKICRYARYFCDQHTDQLHLTLSVGWSIGRMKFLKIFNKFENMEGFKVGKGSRDFGSTTARK